MLCYKDRSYCGSKTHNPDCDRQITPEELEHAKEIGLPIAYMDACETGFEEKLNQDAEQS